MITAFVLVGMVLLGSMVQSAILGTMDLFVWFVRLRMQYRFGTEFDEAVLNEQFVRVMERYDALAES